MTRVAAFLVALGLFLLAGSGSLAGQTAISVNPGTTEMTRDELIEMHERLQAAAESPGYSRQLRQRAEREAELIRERLRNGDFQVGDRIVLRVPGVPRLTDTLSVQAGRVVTLQEVGEIELQGVLRSELQGYLEDELSRYIQDVVVRARSLIRVAVLGAVGAQGFYAIPADALVEEAIMMAGGPAADADIDGTEIRRGDQVLLGGEGLQQAIMEGRTLDQLNLRAGDRIYVPRTAGIFSRGILSGILTLLPTAVLVLTRFL